MRLCVASIFPQYYMHPSILPKESLRKELPWTPQVRSCRWGSIRPSRLCNQKNNRRRQWEVVSHNRGKQKDLVAGFMQNIMQLESSHHTNTRRRKASVAFDNEFDYLYGIVTTGRAFWSLCDIFYQSFVYTNSCLSLFSLGLVLPHVHTGKDLLLKRRLSHSTYRENIEKWCGTSPRC